eukprot:scaffold89972_cov71-Phaeocystis_antarctica.AAC.1
MGMGYDAPCVCISASVRSCAFVVSLAPLVGALPALISNYCLAIRVPWLTPSWPPRLPAKVSHVQAGG